MDRKHNLWLTEGQILQMLKFIESMLTYITVVGYPISMLRAIILRKLLFPEAINNLKTISYKSKN